MPFEIITDNCESTEWYVQVRHWFSKENKKKCIDILSKMKLLDRYMKILNNIKLVIFFTFCKKHDIKRREKWTFPLLII